MDKIAFIDAGELGWSLYLNAHIRWLREKTDSMIAVITYPDRKCLYANLTDDIMYIPDTFQEKYDIKTQDSFKLRKLSWEELQAFFLSYLPKGYRFADYSEYPKNLFSDNRIFAPYEYSKPPENAQGGYIRTGILIFPRCRSYPLWERRNLPEIFYLELLERLCDEFPELTIRTIGTKSGAYDMEINKSNYINWVGKGKDLQEMIDWCQVAIAAIGSQSALPKLSLLQGVPTFVIGHQKGRHVQEENWMKTKIDFYHIDKRAYRTFNDSACVDAIITFVRGVQ